jgi:hypothetical protein
LETTKFSRLRRRTPKSSLLTVRVGICKFKALAQITVSGLAI